MKQLQTIVVAAVILLGLLGLSSLYTVKQTQKALVLTLGKLETASNGQPIVQGPGLHVKMPFISQVIYFDSRLQTMELKDSRIVTSEKKDVIVNSFTKWHITDFPLFYRATNGNFDRVSSLLGAKVSDALRAEFGKRTILEVVSGDRVDIMVLLKKTIDANSKSLGIDVVDMRIKRIDLPTEVSESVYDRMRAEREQAAAQHRADGKREGEKIRANADKHVIELLAEADKQSKTLKGEGDAEAATIYADAYGKNPEFYSFYRSMRAYEKSFGHENDLLVLSPNNQFFNYLRQSGASNAKAAN